MKKHCFPLLLLFQLTIFQNLFLVAQNKQVVFKDENSKWVFGIYPCGEEEFYMTYGKFVFLKKAKTLLMKFDKDLKPAWPKPIEIKDFFLGNTRSFRTPDLRPCLRESMLCSVAK